MNYSRCTLSDTCVGACDEICNAEGWRNLVPEPILALFTPSLSINLSKSSVGLSLYGYGGRSRHGRWMPLYVHVLYVR